MELRGWYHLGTNSQTNGREIWKKEPRKIQEAQLAPLVAVAAINLDQLDHKKWEEREAETEKNTMLNSR